MPVGVTPPYPQNSGLFIPEIWSTRLQVKFYAATVGNVMANTDYEGEIKDVGDVVNIRILGDITISDYTKGETLTYEDLEGDLYQLDIDKAKKFAYKLDDIDKHQSDIMLMDKFAENASERMKIAVDTDFLANVDTGVAATNTGNTAGAISGDIALGSAGVPVVLDKTNVLDYIVDHGTVAVESNIPETGRWFVIPAKVSGLIKKSDLKDASLTGDGTSILRNGRIGMIDSYTLYNSNLLPKTGSVYTIYSGIKEALTFASQFVKVEHLAQLETTFGSAMRGLNVYGYEVSKDDAYNVGFVSVG